MYIFFNINIKHNKMQDKKTMQIRLLIWDIRLLTNNTISGKMIIAKIFWKFGG